MPVASITIWVQPSVDSHSDKAMRSWVVVLNDRTSLSALPSTVWRTQATTISEASRGCAPWFRAPTPHEEDRRRICRERKTLTAERIEHVNRIKGLLFAQGISDYEPLLRKRRA